MMEIWKICTGSTMLLSLGPWWWKRPGKPVALLRPWVSELAVVVPAPGGPLLPPPAAPCLARQDSSL